MTPKGCTAALILFWLAPSSRSEHLPIRTYTTEHGLPSNFTFRILQGSRGHLWFATREGVSRFDGDQFENYGAPKGLLENWITDIMETRAGILWIGTRSRGVCRFDAGTRTERLFTCFVLGTSKYSNSVLRLFEDHAGGIWIGTDAGVFRSRDSLTSGEFVRVPGVPENTNIPAIAEDTKGGVWLGTGGRGLFRIPPSGHIQHFPLDTESRIIWALLGDHRGRIWAGTPKGVIVLAAEPHPGHPLVEETYSVPRGSRNAVVAIDESSDGAIWFGTGEGVGKVHNGVLSVYTRANGLIQNDVRSIAHDNEGNVWLGTATRGVMRVANAGFASFDESDGLATDRIYSLLEDSAGNLCAIAGPPRELFISCFDGGRFGTVRPNTPAWMTDFGWGHDRIAFQDHRGEWWVATGQGLARFATTADLSLLSNKQPKAVYTNREGLGGNEVFRLFEDSRGDIWVSTLDGGIVRWERSTETFHRFPDELGRMQVATAFAEDRRGAIWMAFYEGAIARCRNFRCTVFSLNDGVRPGQIGSMYVDDAGGLWMASYSEGLGHLEHPEAEHPVFRWFTTIHDGLASNCVQSVTTDRSGHLFIGTDRGLDRLDRTTGELRHYSTADGLADDYVETARRDQRGDLWFASSKGGLSRLRYQVGRPSATYPVVINRLRVAGAPYGMNELGGARVPGITLPPGRNHIEIEFGAVHLRAGEVPKYSYKLAGADRDWSEPTGQRSVIYAGLGPGSYRFFVRHAAVDSSRPEDPATVEFVVEPVLWKRPTVLVSIALVIALTAFQVHRFRLAQAVELERIRIRIAADLHDDIGSTLSQIALLSEVARRNMDSNEKGVGPVARIGELSRDLTDSMSDLVWAINPRRDSFSDLTHRMRRFGNDMLAARDIDFAFHTFGFDEKTKLTADARRQVYLIFKELIHNVVRHAACRRVRVEFGVVCDEILLKVSDDGCGAVTSNQTGGHGMDSMRSRAERVEGELTITAEAGCGTTVVISIPVPSRQRGIRLRPW